MVDNVFQVVTISLSPSQIYVIYFIILNVPICHVVCANNLLPFWIFLSYLWNLSMSGINSGHHDLPTYEMSLKSDNIEFVRYCGSHFWKWWLLEIFRCQESIRNIIIYPHMKYHWNRTILNLCGIVVAILKMATARNFSISRIYSGRHNLPTK
jgi:hypothetical protein